MLADYFDGTRETLILLPKKNGKSTTLAALALFHLIATLDAECVIGAASRDQATILYGARRPEARISRDSLAP
jgi:phage terminase large subunit-like protein